jgi:hypothetical protein
MQPERDLRRYVFLAAMLLAPFLGFLIDPNLGLGVLILGLAATLYLLWDARTGLPEASQLRLMVVAGVLVALLVLAAALLAARLLA